MSKEKSRLDVLLVEQGHFESRESARKMIMAGQVLVNESVCDKPGQKVLCDAEIRVKEKPRYVSRGGNKLEGAHAGLGFPVDGLTFLDVGSSTGGFTDFLLQHGAEHVVAVDVGTNQLDYRLRVREDVEVFEKTHILKLDPDQVSCKVDGIVVDVSFISLTRIMEVFPKFAKKGHFLVCMMKPQFEVGKENVGKNGVVRDDLAVKDALVRVYSCLCNCGYRLINIDFSRVPGPKGNIEYFFYLNYEPESSVKEVDFSALLIKKNQHYS
jgi:23S rRNA (cytidine1920-2'-O)/16S rRNA (cytidine1409-2'-O)-methyltransferase